MPHLVLEYTDNVSQKVAFDDLFARLHQVLVATVSAAPEACKSRAVPLHTYYLADGRAGRALVHLTIAILAGRSDELKMNLSEQCLQVLTEFYRPSLAALDLQISVEVRDMHRDSYRRIP